MDFTLEVVFVELKIVLDALNESSFFPVNTAGFFREMSFLRSLVWSTMSGTGFWGSGVSGVSGWMGSGSGSAGTTF